MFTGETLKYLYLLQAEGEPLPLDRWVLNTEAHPLLGFGDSGFGAFARKS